MLDGAFAGRTALVIEDEPFTRAVLARMVAGLGFREVRQAGDGNAGLESVRSQRPDVVLCDVEMRPVDGIGFLKAVRAEEEPETEALPVVFLTNRIEPAIVAEASPLGAEIFLEKPANPGLLREKLLRALGAG